MKVGSHSKLFPTTLTTCENIKSAEYSYKKGLSNKEELIVLISPLVQKTFVIK